MEMEMVYHYLTKTAPTNIQALSLLQVNKQQECKRAGYKQVSEHTNNNMYKQYTNNNAYRIHKQQCNPHRVLEKTKTLLFQERSLNCLYWSIQGKDTTDDK